MSRGRLIALVGCLVAAVVIVGLALGGDRGDGHALPDGGSSFRDTGGEHPNPGTGPMDALAGVRDDGAQGATATTPATPATPAATTTTTKAATPGAALPATQAGAAARLFLIGFGGTRPTKGLLQRMALREWGGVVLEKGNA